jgi:hypothetical protein
LALPVFCTVFVKLTTPEAFVLLPGGLPAMPVETLLLVKSSLFVLLVAPGAPTGPFRTLPLMTSVVVRKGDVALMRALTELFADAVP